VIARVLTIGVLVAGLTSVTLAQRGAGGRGGGGDDFGGQPLELSRMELLTRAFKLNKDQKDKIKAILDEAHKSAAPARDGLTRTRTAIAGAVQSGKSQAEVDAAVKSYAEQATAMTGIEMKALANVLKSVDPEMASNPASVQTAFFMFRGMFLNNKKWDLIPYRY
jgi:Spy/CpxP family protein refolding chaperone